MIVSFIRDANSFADQTTIFIMIMFIIILSDEFRYLRSRAQKYLFLPHGKGWQRWNISVYHLHDHHVPLYLLWHCCQLHPPTLPWCAVRLHLLRHPLDRVLALHLLPYSWIRKTPLPEGENYRIIGKSVDDDDSHWSDHFRIQFVLTSRDRSSTGDGWGGKV